MILRPRVPSEAELLKVLRSGSFDTRKYRRAKYIALGKLRFTEEEMLAELKRIASHIGRRRLSVGDIDKYSREMTSQTLRNRGGIKRFIEMAGLIPFEHPSEECLLREGARVFINFRHLPTADAFERYSEVSSDLMVKRLGGSWRAVKDAIQLFLKQNER